MTIKIESTYLLRDNMSIFGFRVNNKFILMSPLLENFSRCEVCNDSEVNSVYVRIIKELKEAGILDKDYKLLCCACYSKQHDIKYQEYIKEWY